MKRREIENQGNDEEFIEEVYINGELVTDDDEQEDEDVPST